LEGIAELLSQSSSGRYWKEDISLFSNMKPSTSSFFHHVTPIVLIGLCLLSLSQARAGAVSLQRGTATNSQAGGTPTSAINGTTTGNDAWGLLDLI
jgi:hypothetical protein